MKLELTSSMPETLALIRCFSNGVFSLILNSNLVKVTFGKSKILPSHAHTMYPLIFEKLG